MKRVQDKLAEETKISTIRVKDNHLFINDIKVANYDGGPTGNCQILSVDIINPELFYAAYINTNDKLTKYLKDYFEDYLSGIKHQLVLTCRKKYLPEDFVKEICSDYTIRHKTLHYSDKKKYVTYFISFTDVDSVVSNDSNIK